MNKIVYKADERGYADHGWLKAKHSFSFADYYDPAKVHFGTLRVLNDDIIAGGKGFGMHPHDNMEIVTIPLKGSIEHRDSQGNHGVINAGDIQLMSAGKGIMHSEFNHSPEDELNLLQIWVFPKVKNIDPVYGQKTFSPDIWKDKLYTIVSPEGTDGSLKINQDAYFSIGELSKGLKLDYNIKHEGNGVYIFVIEGEVNINGDKYGKRDAVGLSDLNNFEIESLTDSKILIIDLPMRVK